MVQAGVMIDPLKRAHARAVELLGKGKTVGPSELSELASLREELNKGKQQHKGPAEGSFVGYPDIQDPKFAAKLVAKREFAEHAIDVSKNGRRGCSTSEVPTEFELTRTQLIVRNFLAPGTPYNGALLFHSVGVGKCHAIDTPILMYDGTIKKVQDIVEGDSLMGDDSTPRTVLSLARGTDKMYDVIPIKGDKYTVNEEHILCLKATGYPMMRLNDYKDNHNYQIQWVENNRFCCKTFTFGDKCNEEKDRQETEAKSFFQKITWEQIVEISVKDYLNLSTCKKDLLKGYRTAVDFDEKPLPIDPYMIGYWLGDGSKRDPLITCQDSVVLHYFNKEVINNKHIPHIYKCNSRENRLKLLAGLLDSDGSYGKGFYEFSQSLDHEEIIDDVIYLCRSLGFACYKKEKTTSWTYKGVKNNGWAWRIIISGHGIEEIPTLCPRKKATKRMQVKDVLVSGITVQYSKTDDYYGFTLDGNSRYVMGDFTVTHNTCTAVTVAEQCLDMGAHSKVLVITRPGLRENFKKTVFDMSKVPRKPDGSLNYGQSSQCTGTSYPDRIPDRRSLSSEQVESKIDRIIRNRYEFMGVGEFANVVEALGSGPATLAVERLRQRFSNMVIIVDEAHNLRIGGKEGGGEGGEGGKRIKRATPALRRVLRCTENVKLLLLTATPMFNRSADVIDLINLLLANDKRPPIKMSDIFNKEGSLTKDGEARLRAASRGYISYAAVDDPFSFPMRLWPSGRPYGTDRKGGGRDPEVLRPSDVPRIDIRGDPIPPNMRLHADSNGGIEIIASPLGSKQRDVYLAVEDKLRAVPEEVEDEDDAVVEEDAAEKNNLASSAASALYAGLQTCNIAFPNSLKFDGCFKKRPTGSGSVQLEYRPNVPRFLEPSKLPLYAPKIAAIVKRIQSSKGIVMVYSRFLSAGLIPIAIALEHLGFKRFESAPLLGGDGVGRGASPTSRGGVYAIISGNREYRTDESRTVESLKSKENSTGGIIKVILVSDRGSEGIDLRYVREVHVLEPWFHLNKIEQVVGRAARFCSHSALPQEERNLTVYLHATTKGGGGSSETVDLRAYRLAEHKNVQIRKVENVLRSVSIDCKLRELGTASMLSEAANTRVSMRTSQWHQLRDVPLHQKQQQHGMCESPPPPPKESLDESTYDPTGRHAYHHSTFSNMLVNYFVKTGRVSASFDDFLKHATYASSTEMTDEVKERLATELDLLIKTGKEIEGPHGGRMGKMIHRGDLYLFQPFDEDTQVLTEVERAARKRRASLALDVALLKPESGQGSEKGPSGRDEGRQSRSIRAAEAALIGLDSDVSSLLSRTQVSSGPYRNVAVDFVVDRLPHVRLVRLATACVMNPSVLNLSDRLTRERAQAAKSLRNSGKILRNDPSKGPVATLISPYLTDGRIVRIDTNNGTSREEVDPKAIKDSSKMKRRMITKDVVGAVVILPNEGRAVFKVLEDRLAPGAPKNRDEDEVRALTDGGRGSGCVCHQSSILSTERLRELIALESRGEPSAIAASEKVQDKRTLCELYELVLRKHRVSGLVP